MAKTWLQRLERAKAMAFPPAPAKASMIVVLEDGMLVLMWSAIRLRGKSQYGGRKGKRGEEDYFAIGSGVTPNQTSSVIQIPSS